jgi:hypothetical protein
MERYRSEKIILQAGLLEILNKKNINLHLEKLEFERLAGKNMNGHFTNIINCKEQYASTKNRRRNKTIYRRSRSNYQE